MAVRREPDIDPDRQVQNVVRGERLIHGGALAVAATIALAFPIAVGVLGYRDAVGLRTYQAELEARQVARYAYTQGPTWRFSQHRVAELARQVAPTNDPGWQEIIPADGRGPITFGEIQAAPILRVEAPIVVGRETVGSVASTASLRPLLLETLIAAVVGLIAAIAAYVCVRVPLDRLRLAVAALVQAKEEICAKREYDAECRIADLNAELGHVSRVSALGEMATSFAHELNQPLAAITNFAAGSRIRLARGCDPTTELSPILQRIEDEACRAGAVIRGIRGFIGRRGQEVSTIDLGAVVRDAGQLVASKAAERNVLLTIDAGTDTPCPIVGNRVQIQQILVNLILNAFDAIGERDGPRWVKVDVRRDAGTFVVRVADSGSGIKVDDIEKLFDPFFTTKSAGMGMGLAICRTIATQHGGTIHAANAPSGGAVFTLALPVGRESAPAAASALA